MMDLDADMIRIKKRLDALESRPQASTPALSTPTAEATVPPDVYARIGALESFRDEIQEILSSYREHKAHAAAVASAPETSSITPEPGTGG